MLDTALAREPRQCALTAIRDCLESGCRSLRDDFEAGSSSAALLRGRAQLVDKAVTDLCALTELPREANIVAVGGYGRGELFPHSDVDLMVLLEARPTGELEERISDFVSALWDIGLEIGMSVRTIDECVETAQDDITIQTNLLEARLLRGDPTLFERMRERYQAGLDARAFFKAKSLEQQQRHARFNDTPYALEPNCKESPGGLRDLQMLGWIARASDLAIDWRDLARKRLITGAEARELRNIQRFLQHVRIRLHYLSGRAEDRLLFDYQESLAKELGFEATQAKRASEVMMQRYYVTAKKVTQINTLLLQNFANVLFPEQSGEARPINDRFQAVSDLLDVVDDEVFERHPPALLEAFLLMQQNPELKGMTARTLRLLWTSRRLINARFRADPINRGLFLEILQQPRGIVHELRRMNQYGILGRYLPAWHRIVCQMQHDLFHVYTVDQHILMVVRNVRQFTMGKHAHEYPLMTRLMLGFERHWLLYIAALFHDIAKGRGGDHSKLGMADARQFCQRHGLSDDDTDLIVWLVEQHLTMSQVAQKQDTSDPEVVRRFADIVGSERRLIALYLLTHADIRGTSPKVWNGWRGKLLEDLFFATQRLLRGATPQQALGLDQRQDDARSLLRYHGLRPGIEDELWSRLDAVYFMRNSADDIAWHTRLLYHRSDSAEPVVKARVSSEYQGVQVMVFTRDRKDLFAHLTGLFGRLGFSILEAKVQTTRHGYALDSFVLQDPGGEGGNYRDVITLIEHEVETRLKDDSPPDGPGSGRLSRHVKYFPVTPGVSIRPDDAGRHHILSITAADRPGVLFAIAEILARNAIIVHTAKITTLGERIEDTFLLSGEPLADERKNVRLQREIEDALQV
ncbi:MAG: [protein-PII] uridylyltransferase [Azoarcus sp.]|nr:[protein-PII] uridylyltransferase [Azoarcus sp.]